MAKNNIKQPKRTIDPHPSKQVRQGERPELDENSILWSFSLFDDFPRWATHDGANHFCSVACHLKSKQGLTWSQIRGNHSKDHLVSVDKLAKEAKERLEQLRMDDIDELISLRFTGRQRIFGIKQGCVFQVLWWDPNHQVCPSSWPPN